MKAGWGGFLGGESYLVMLLTMTATTTIKIKMIK